MIQCKKRGRRYHKHKRTDNIPTLVNESRLPNEKGKKKGLHLR